MRLRQVTAAIFLLASLVVGSSPTSAESKAQTAYVQAAIPNTVLRAPAARAPLPDEVQLRVFQYATGEHALNVACGAGDVENETPVYNLVIDRPFQYRIEPRWTGGKENLDVIFEVKIFTDLTGQRGDDATSAEGENTWSQLTHLGPQTANREMAQIGQHVTLGSGNLLHPQIGGPLKFDFVVDFQLGKQNGPKRTCEAEVRVWREGDPDAPAE